MIWLYLTTFARQCPSDKHLFHAIEVHTKHAISAKEANGSAEVVNAHTKVYETHICTC